MKHFTTLFHKLLTFWSERESFPFMMYLYIFPACKKRLCNTKKIQKLCKTGKKQNLCNYNNVLW